MSETPDQFDPILEAYLEKEARNVEDFERDLHEPIVALRAELSAAEAKVDALMQQCDKHVTKIKEMIVFSAQVNQEVEELATALKGYVMGMAAGNPTILEHADKQARAILGRALVREQQNTTQEDLNSTADLNGGAKTMDGGT